MTTATIETAVPHGTWEIDQAHSTANFEVEHGSVSVFRGGFSPIQAKLTSSDSGLELTGSVPVDGVSIDDENIRPHILSPEFFDAARNPEVSFHSTEIIGDAGDLTVKGELSLAGLSREVEATGRIRGPVEFPGGVEKLSVSLETTIDRTEYGMNWQMELPSGESILGNDVKLIVELELLRN